MIVAFDSEDRAAVLGPEIDQTRQRDTNASSDRYSCLFCEEPLIYDGEQDGISVGYFIHDSGSECFSDGNISLYHRLGQEVSTKTIANWLPHSIDDLQFEIEKRIGNQSNFVISDILVSEPVHIAVEIIYVNTRLCLQRRLKTLFNQDYPVMLIFLTNGGISPSRVEHHLQTISSIEVGRFNPYSCKLRFGSLIMPDDTDPDKIDWDAIPAYLS